MVVTKFKLPEYTKEELENEGNFLLKLFTDVKNQFSSEGIFIKLIYNNKATYNSDDLITGQKPEDLVKEFVVRKLLEHLGYEVRQETKIKSIKGLRWADYLALNPNTGKEMFYVEAEPFNTDLTSENRGLEQIKPLLLSKMAKAEYGIATDGFRWVLIKFDEGIKEILKVNLLPIVSTLFNESLNENTKDELQNLLSLKLKNFEILTNDYLVESEENKKEISKKFYADYIKYVLGKDENGNAVAGVSLLSSIIPPPEGGQKELFALVTMNRLLFIAFLQDKSVVPKNFLRDIYEKYKSQQQPLTFYKSFLSPIFYEVFNRELKDRTKTDYNNIPYLNGGLFRDNLPGERDYDIKDEGLLLVINSLIFKYDIGLSGESELRPEILGYIFEKTVNYISGSGTEKRKAEGTYYTPDDVVNFIIDKAVSPVVFSKLTKALRHANMRDSDIEAYKDLNDLLENLPENPKYLRGMLKELDNLKIMDPACGSGHFLVAATNFLIRIRFSLLLRMGEHPSLYDIKRRTISNNIFGVDINEIAVEISKLRLWLSVIAEIKDAKADISHIGTLPNIDFNIVPGNTLVGQLNEQLTMTIDYESIANNKEIVDKISILENREVLYKKLNERKNEEIYGAYHLILNEYKLSSGIKAKNLHDVLIFLRSKIYELADKSFLSYYLLSANTPLNKPLHWYFDFYDIFKNGGFDAVIGNPPYVENNNYSREDLRIINLELKKSRKWKKNHSASPVYYSNKSGNTYAYFIERSTKILSSGGKLGFIVPISLISTERMRDIRGFIHDNSSEVAYYNFDDRPGKLFNGMYHSRSTILILQKGGPSNKVTTTSCLRWLSENRPQLFRGIKTLEIDLNYNSGIMFFGNIVPKVGDLTEINILKKLKQKSNGKSLKDYIGSVGCQHIYYYDASGNYIHAHTEENYNSIGRSGHYKSVCVNSSYHKLVVAILNSSLFYWWFRVWSDERDVLIDHIADFPIDLGAFNGRMDEVNALTDLLMGSYIERAVIRKNKRKGGYEIEIKEIHPGSSQDILDKIDNLIMDVLGFNDIEKGFILNYERSFRLGDKE